MKKTTRITRDYHGLTVLEAIDDLDKLIFHHTHSGKEIELIVGHGKIKKEVEEYLHTLCFRWSYKFNNDGCIVFMMD